MAEDRYAQDRYAPPRILPITIESMRYIEEFGTSPGEREDAKEMREFMEFRRDNPRPIPEQPDTPIGRLYQTMIELEFPTEKQLLEETGLTPKSLNDLLRFLVEGGYLSFPDYALGNLFVDKYIKAPVCPIQVEYRPGCEPKEPTVREKVLNLLREEPRTWGDLHYILNASLEYFDKELAKEITDIVMDLIREGAAHIQVVHNDSLIVMGPKEQK